MSIELANYLQNSDIPYPVLVDQFMQASEAELDLAADGKNIMYTSYNGTC